MRPETEWERNCRLDWERMLAHIASLNDVDRAAVIAVTDRMLRDDLPNLPIDQQDGAERLWSQMAIAAATPEQR